MNEQKRQYIRHPASIPIVCERTNATNAFREPLRNISIGGLCFRSACVFEPDASITVKIDLVRPVFRGQARVVWCHRSDDQHYDVGVQFRDPKTGARARIVEQICHIEQYKQDVLEGEGRHLSGEEAAIEWIHKYADDFPQA